MGVSTQRCLLSQWGLSELDQHTYLLSSWGARLWLALGQQCCAGLGSSVVRHQLLMSAPWAQEQPAHTRLACLQMLPWCLAKGSVQSLKAWLHSLWICLLAAVQMGRDGGRMGVGSLIAAFCHSGTLPVWRHFLAAFMRELMSTSRAAALECGHQCVSKDPNHRKGIQAPCEIGTLHSTVPPGHLEPVSSPLTLILGSCKFLEQPESMTLWGCGAAEEGGLASQVGWAEGWPCMSHHLILTLYFGRDLVGLNVLRRSNIALKTPYEVRCWISLLCSSYFPIWAWCSWEVLGCCSALLLLDSLPRSSRGSVFP